MTQVLSTSLTAGKASAPAVVRAEGAWFELEDGRRVLDGSNTAAPLGHGHPDIVAAVRSAAGAPVLNEGWRYKPREEAARALVETAMGGEDWIGAVRFFLSASEANDAALVLAQALTGRAALATRERAYHGGAGLAREMTVQPHWHGGLSTMTGGIKAPPKLADVRVLPAPSGARILGDPDPTEGSDWETAARKDLGESAAVLIDYSQGGIYHSPDYQDRVARLAAEAGCLWIADETVTGFGRTGQWMQYTRGESRPDMVTMGKSLAAGGAAAGALVLSRDVLSALEGTSWQTYSTFRGHPVQVEAIRAHIEASARQGVHARAAELDSLVCEHFERIASEHPSVRRIDGRGLLWTLEVHGPDWRDWRGEEAEPLASRIAAGALEAGTLFATSGEQTSIFLAPPLIIGADELDQALVALGHGLAVADRELASA